jgi:hypothetical protein
MEQPRVQIQNESRSEMINTVLACGKCMKDITTSGECECHELFIASGDMEFYRRYFLCLIKHFIRTGVPNLTPLDGNIAFRNDTNGATDTYHYAANGLKAEFGPWDSSDIDVEQTEDQEESISSYLSPAAAESVSESSYETGTSSNQQNLNHISQNIEQSLISNPCEENIEGDDKKLNYLQIRLTTVTFMSGKCAVIVDILGQHFDWQQILRQVESDILELRWRFYHFDGICDGYGQIDYAAFNTEDEFDSNANEFGDGIDYVFDSNAEEEYEIIFDDDDDNFNRGPPPASKSAIESLPTHIVCVDSGDAYCCICTETIPIGDEAKILPCNHYYHSACIIKWLGFSNFCPLCRYKLPSDVHEDQQQE